MLHLCAPHLKNIWNNETASQQQFADDLKLADVTPVFKKEEYAIKEL